MKKSTKRILFAAGASVAAIYGYNKFIESTATQKNLLTKENGNIYNWKNGNIFYTKSGNGSPLLLIHDADASASSVEWSRLLSHLEEKHTVYCIDLLGCGRSDKPALEYTNYLYVQLITSFVKDVISEKTTVVATNISSSFVIMANHMDDTLFDKIILINPVSLDTTNTIPDETSKLKKRIIELPFIGSFIYNVMTNSKHIDESFRNKYYESPQLISASMEETYYEAAHTNGSNGRYLYSSLLGNYLNNTMTHAIKDLSKPTLIIGNTGDDYQEINPMIDMVTIVDCNLYPHMETPDEVSITIEEFLQKETTE